MTNSGTGPSSHAQHVGDSELLDPDVDRGHSGFGRSVSLHLRPLYLVVIFVGGTLGTLSRWAIGPAFAHPTSWPTATMIVNLVGSFVLGLLLEALVRSGPDHGNRRLLRLGLGTGFCGAFTTYSALSVDTLGLLQRGLIVPAGGYLAITLIGGAALAWLGITLGAKRSPTSKLAR